MNMISTQFLIYYSGNTVQCLFYNDISDLTNDEVVFVRLTSREALPIRKSISKLFEFKIYFYSYYAIDKATSYMFSMYFDKLGPTSQDRLIYKLTML